VTNLAIIPNLIQFFGSVGQGFFSIRRNFLHLTALCALFALMFGCGPDPGERLQSGRVMALRGIEGRWVGSVMPSTPNCGGRRTGVMAVGSSTFAFDPFQSTIALNGRILEKRILKGEQVRPGGATPEASIVFDGIVVRTEQGEEAISGTLSSGRCRWSVRLHRG